MPIEKLTPITAWTDQRLDVLRSEYPQCFVDGKVNKELLLEVFGEILEDETQEHFGLFWPGKRESRRLAALPSKGTLIPQPGAGVDEDSTHNLFIEGDNLEVLKLLQKSYAGRVKMIYIDPPYNTGGDFIYSDNFTEPLESYLKMTGQVDEEGQPLTTNNRADGRFHSNWLNMIYPRLLLAKNLLSEEGVIFISIDDNEFHHLRSIMSEIFGEENVIETLVWKRRGTAPNDRIIGKNHEYIVCYSKSKEYTKLFLQPRTEDLLTAYKNPDNDPRGTWRASDLSANGKGGRLVQSCIFPIKNPQTGKEFLPPENKCWLYNAEKVASLITDNRIGFRENTGAPFLKRFLSEVRQGVTQPTIIDDGGFSMDSAREIRELFDQDVFEFPKPTKLIKKLITIGANGDDIVLDLTAGSCTTAQAVIELNREDNGNRRFIMVQIPEGTPPDSPARKLEYKSISEIGRERVRRVLSNIKSNNKKELKLNPIVDLGFSSFRLDFSHFKGWDTFTGKDISQLELRFEKTEIPLVEGWKPNNLRTEILLLQGFPLDSQVRSLSEFKANEVQQVTSEFIGHHLYICLDKKVKAETVAKINLRPEDILVCLDSALSDEAKVKLADQCNLKVI